MNENDVHSLAVLGNKSDTLILQYGCCAERVLPSLSCTPISDGHTRTSQNPKMVADGSNSLDTPSFCRPIAPKQD